MYTMFRKDLSIFFAILVFLMSVSGCGIRNLFPSKEVPSLEDYSKIVVVFFNEEPSETYEDLPTLISYTVGTRMSIKCEDKEWCFDQTHDNCPVSKKLDDLGIKPCDICQNHNLATKLADATGADLVIVGRLNKPRYTEDRSGKVEYDMSKVSVTGADRYYAIYQTAMLKANFDIIDPKTGQSVWCDKIIGYKKYKTRYKTGNPPVWQPEKTMFADVRMDLVQKVIDKLYPAMTGQET
jgi:hypothetical protein